GTCAQSPLRCFIHVERPCISILRRRCMMFLKLSVTVCILSVFFFVSPALTETPLPDPLMIELVPITGGCFQMGDSVGDGDPNERPVHEVCVSDFSIGKFEVTNTQYKKFDPEHNSGISEDSTLDGGDQ